MTTDEYAKYGKEEFPERVRYQKELKPYEKYEVLAGSDNCDDGSDQWFLVKAKDEDDYVLITIDVHLFSDNDIKIKHFDSLLSACDYIRDNLDGDFSLGGAEVADAVISLLDTIIEG